MVKKKDKIFIELLGPIRIKIINYLTKLTTYEEKTNN